MKLTYVLAFSAVLGMTACTGGKSTTQGDGVVENDSTEIIVEEVPALAGEWRIEDITEGNKTIRPSATDDGGPQYVSFNEDGSFGTVTNCNSVNGDWKMSADSISFSNLMSTLMSCPDMSVEESLRKILPEVKTMSWTGDSVIRLNTSSQTAVITLKRMK